MIRPISIVRYERVYILSVLLGLVGSALGWSGRAGALRLNPVLAGQDWLLWAGLIAGIVVSVALWFYTARRPSIVAKWIVVVLAGFAVLGLLFSIFELLTGRATIEPATIVTLIVNILYAVAARMLFHPDALLWFGESPLSHGDLS